LTASVEELREVKHMIIAILAWSGAALSCLLIIPQAIRTLRTDRLDAISATTYWIVLGNAVIWAAWSVLTQQYAAGVPALVNGPAAILILLRLHRTNPAAATPHGRPEPRADVAASPTAVDGIALAPQNRVPKGLRVGAPQPCAPQPGRGCSPRTPRSTGTRSRARCSERALVAP
jgi:uncharacterized protein with PQ loop repeat